MAIEKFDPDSIDWIAEFTIIGEAQAKGNRRRLVKHGSRTVPIKSEKSLLFVQGVFLQAPKLTPLPEDDLLIAMEIFYGSRRPDLDESLILDALQGKCYKNDRQVKQKHIWWGLDKENPHANIKIAYR